MKAEESVKVSEDHRKRFVSAISFGGTHTSVQVKRGGWDVGETHHNSYANVTQSSSKRLFIVLSNLATRFHATLEPDSVIVHLRLPIYAWDLEQTGTLEVEGD